MQVTIYDTDSKTIVFDKPLVFMFEDGTAHGVHIDALKSMFIENLNNQLAKGNAAIIRSDNAPETL